MIIFKPAQPNYGKLTLLYLKQERKRDRLREINTFTFKTGGGERLRKSKNAGHLSNPNISYGKREDLTYLPKVQLMNNCYKIFYEK